MTTHVNSTPFSTLAFDTQDQWERGYHVAVTRATFELTDSGELHLAGEQTPVATADRYHGEPGLSSLRQESDLAPYKPRCDIVLDATAYAPKGVPVRSWAAGIRVGTHPLQQLRVTGPRRWQHKLLGGWEAGLPEPIASLPLRYEYAYGGRVTLYDPKTGREHTDHCPHNPLGLGYWPPATHAEARRRGPVPIPQILAIEDAWPPFGQPLSLEGLAPIPKTWPPRSSLAGTCDEPWRTGHWPNLPQDFDFGLWNSAHPDLQIPYLTGDEPVELHNLTPQGRLDFRLPGYLPLILVRYQNGKAKTMRANLDTLFIVPDERRVDLVWRATIPAEPPVQVLESHLPTERQT